MDTQQPFVTREKRFEVNEAVGFDAIVNRTGSDDSMFYADLIDFSRTGMKLNLPFCARFDEILNLKLEFRESVSQYEGVCRVRHMRNISENRWQVGCSIDPAIPDEIIELLATKTNQERRKYSRIEVIGKGKLRRENTDDVDALVKNLSRGGFCLEVSEPHNIGERVDFLTLNPSGEIETFAARVRWQDETEDGYEIGCGFAESTSFKTLTECFGVGDQYEAKSPFSWHVLAAAVVALVLPTVSYFMMDQGNTNTNFAAPSVVVGQNDQGESDQFDAGSKSLIDSNDPEKNVVVDSVTEKRNESPLENEDGSQVAIGENSGKPSIGSDSPISPLTSVSPSPDTLTDASRNKLVVSRPVFEEEIPMNFDALGNSSRRIFKKPRPKIQQSPTLAQSDDIQDSSSLDRPNRESKRESKIFEMPKELTEFVDRQPKAKRFEKGSSRRVLPVRPMMIPSEEIRPSP